MENIKRKVLIVEDEKNIALLLSFNLTKAGFETDCAHDGEEGLKKALTGDFDVVLLDIMLPKLDGFQVLEGIRTRSDVPVIMVTARDDEKDKIQGLENGADDYVTKPFSMNEVIARIRANIRRSRDEIVHGKESEEDGVISVRGLSIDRRRYIAYVDGREVELTKTEYDLLRFLMENLGTPHSYRDLLIKVWGSEYAGEDNTVNVTMSRLRQKLGEDPSNPKYIFNRRGFGYYVQ